MSFPVHITNTENTLTAVQVQFPWHATTANKHMVMIRARRPVTA